MHLRQVAAALAAAASLGPAASLAEAADPLPLRPAGATTPLGNEMLTDGLTLARWAHVQYRVQARVAPSRQAKGIARLRFQTVEGRAEVIPVLESRRIGEGVWLRVRLPIRPNGTTGWVPRSALSKLRTTTQRLVVDRKAFRATLYEDGKVIWTSRVGVGKPSTPTPSGHFVIRQRIRNLKGSPVYGPWAFGTSAVTRLSEWPGGGVVGVHGTNQPGLLPGRVSNGCVRMPNAAVRRLARLLDIGTPLRIY